MDRLRVKSTWNIEIRFRYLHKSISHLNVSHKICLLVIDMAKCFHMSNADRVRDSRSLKVGPICTTFLTPLYGCSHQGRLESTCKPAIPKLCRLHILLFYPRWTHGQKFLVSPNQATDSSLPLFKSDDIRNNVQLSLKMHIDDDEVCIRICP